MAKAKREEKAAEGEYEFRLPSFDEPAFIRREIQGAKASFYTIALGFLCGGAALGANLAMPDTWMVGWLPILLAMAGLRPLLQKIGFDEDVVKPKALIGSYFMLFFTGLAVWILGVNVV